MRIRQPESSHFLVQHFSFYLVIITVSFVCSITKLDVLIKRKKKKTFFFNWTCFRNIVLLLRKVLYSVPLKKGGIFHLLKFYFIFKSFWHRHTDNEMEEHYSLSSASCHSIGKMYAAQLGPSFLRKFFIKSTWK